MFGVSDPTGQVGVRISCVDCVIELRRVELQIRLIRKVGIDVIPHASLVGFIAQLIEPGCPVGFFVQFVVGGNQVGGRSHDWLDQVSKDLDEQ